MICNVVTSSPYALLPTLCVRLKIGTHFSRQLRIICDSGSQTNIITNSVVNEFKLVREAARVSIQGVNGQISKAKGKVNLEMWHRNASSSIAQTTFVVLQDQLADQPQITFEPEPFDSHVGTDLADPQYATQGNIDALIGVGVLSRHMRNGIERNLTGLLAQNTSFGWIISGETTSSNAIEEASLYTVSTVIHNDLSRLIQKLWEIDEMDGKLMTIDEQLCEEHFKNTVVRRNNRYSVQMPIKPDMELGQSRAMAIRRLFAQENKFKRDPTYKELYVNFMTEYEQLGHMRPAKLLDPNSIHYYIPHHAVSIDRKPRVVFDGSAKSTNGRSLNDIQYTGPRLQKDLIDIIMKFRTGKIAISADICKMYRQIEIQPVHWDLQRIVWRANPSQPIRDYWLTVVTYGLASSPYLAVKALNQCAIDNAAEKPDAGSTS